MNVGQAMRIVEGLPLNYQGPVEAIPSRDQTLFDRLDALNETLTQCESYLQAIDDKISGPGPSNGHDLTQDSPSPAGVNQLVSCATEAAARIRDRLELLSGYIG